MERQMIIKKIKIVNYKIFTDITVDMNTNSNIFVGENDAGKTTILEAITMALTGKINGVNINSRLSPDWFNFEKRLAYKDSLVTDDPQTPPNIEIELFFDKYETDAKVKSFTGTNNSLHEDASGVKLEIKFNDDYSETYKQLIKEKKISDIPVEL